MAIEYVGGNSNSGKTNTTVSVSLTNLTGGLSSSPAEGDIVVVCISNTGYSTPSVSTSGYSNFYTAISRDATYPNYMISSYKIMGSTPDTSVSCVFSSGSSSKAASVVVYVWRGVNTTTPIDVTPQTTTGIASTGTPIVPPAITPITTGALVVITAGLSCQNSSTPNLNDPTDYSNLVSINGFGSNGNAGVLISSKSWGGSGAETPGTVSRSPGSPANAFCASTFALRPAVDAPTVTTQAVSSITSNSAVGNGNITDTGGVNATRRGFCYKAGSSGDPTTSDSVVYDDGSFGTGAYTKAITGLTPNTEYRVRAYAVNSAGTSYGTTVSLTTIGTNIQINIGDAWKEVESMQVNIGDTWKTVESVQINIGDSWKTIF